MSGRIYAGKKAIEPGTMEREHLLMPAELSRINSQRVISALDDHLVEGMSRKDACEKNGVAQGYFSIIVRKLFETHEIVKNIVFYYDSVINTVLPDESTTGKNFKG